MQYRRRKKARRTAAAQERARERFVAKWIPKSVGFTDEQGDLIRQLTDEANMSLGELFDVVFGEYFPRKFHLFWPYAYRSKRQWRIHEHKARKPKTNMRIYAMLFSREQARVLERALIMVGNRYGQFSAIVEEAFATVIPEKWGREWPHGNRKRPVLEVLRPIDPDDLQVRNEA